MILEDVSKCDAYKKGRWFHFLIESDGTAYTVTLEDVTATVAAGELFLPTEYHVLDYVFDWNPIALNTKETVAKSIIMDTDGTQGVLIPEEDKCDWVEVWVFAHL